MRKEKKMKTLDFDDIKNISNSISYKTYFEWVDYALKNKNSFKMPSKTRIHQDNSDYFAIMPCLYEKENVLAVKTIGRHEIKNESDCRPVMMSDIVLYDSNTGALKALMDCEYITTLRTGVSAAHSALLFARSDYKTMGLIGIGNIMVAFLSSFLECYDKRELLLKVFKHKGQEKRVESIVDSFADETKACVKIEYYDSYEKVIAGSDIVVSAVTKAEENFCNDDIFKTGCTIIPICTKGFMNCDLTFDKVFTDEKEQIKDFKYYNYFKSLNSVSDVLNKNAEGRKNNAERIIVYNYGLAIHDLFFALRFLEFSNAKETIYRYCKTRFFM